ncbi:hypothetical protein CB0940_09967 [Cercospora beticola]|uniref:Uncharacterized protein n=2 Tax=Cercospora beticola TaxID=122368 RepID=A0A2G5HHS5_CERBT|nr:hypothetical protein CB0940_09967 [Cercospora beticola]PIA92055.1 hypothetical protein CB0940_09967 [Cercospora beticola]CAK1365528.1 unnamed protein product [Cercospora beticola]
MSNTSTSLRVPQLLEPIHPQHQDNTSISDRDLTMSEAQSFPDQSSRNSLSVDEKELHGSAHRDSTSSNEGGVNGRSLTYATNTSTEPAELSAYDHDRALSASATPSSSRSRSRSRGSYDMHRMSQDGGNRWADDKEAKQKKMLRKIMDHKLAPSFLK